MIKDVYRSCPANLSLLACFFISFLKLRSATISRRAICTASVRDLAPRTLAASSTSRVLIRIDVLVPAIRFTPIFLYTLAWVHACIYAAWFLNHGGFLLCAVYSPLWP